jgi:hypothetical protein
MRRERKETRTKPYEKKEEDKINNKKAETKNQNGNKHRVERCLVASSFLLFHNMSKFGFLL